MMLCNINVGAQMFQMCLVLMIKHTWSFKQPLVSGHPLVSSLLLKVQQSLKTQRRVGIHDLQRRHVLERKDGTLHISLTCYTSYLHMLHTCYTLFYGLQKDGRVCDGAVWGFGPTCWTSSPGYRGNGSWVRRISRSAWRSLA